MKMILKKFEYFQGKQTLKQLSIKYDKSIPWVKKYLDAYQPDEIKILPSKVIIVADATFFSKRKDKMGTLVFKDVINNKIIATKHIQSERCLIKRTVFVCYSSQLLII